MIILDSSFLIAFFKEDDRQHGQAVQDMKKYDENKEEMLITEHVMGETATVLLYYNGLDAAIGFLDFAREKCIIQNWDREEFHSALRYFREQKHELSYIDASIVYMAIFLHLPVACYDKDILDEIKERIR